MKALILSDPQAGVGDTKHIRCVADADVVIVVGEVCTWASRTADHRPIGSRKCRIGHAHIRFIRPGHHMENDERDRAFTVELS